MYCNRIQQQWRRCAPSSSFRGNIQKPHSFDATPNRTKKNAGPIPNNSRGGRALRELLLKRNSNPNSNGCRRNTNHNRGGRGVHSLTSFMRRNESGVDSSTSAITCQTKTKNNKVPCQNGRQTGCKIRGRVGSKALPTTTSAAASALAPTSTS